MFRADVQKKTIIDKIKKNTYSVYTRKVIRGIYDTS